MRISLLATACLTLASALPAQQNSPAKPFRESVTVSEVLLDVTVFDRRTKQHVLDLGPEDFTVLEDGEEREVTSVSLRRVGLGTGGAGLGEGEPRYFVLFFHDVRRHGRVVSAYLQSRRWIRDALRPGDFVALVSHHRGLRVHQDFTRDRDALADAFARAMMRRRPASLDDPGLPSIREHLPSEGELEARTAHVGEALAILANALRPVEGRKHLLLLSTGLTRAGRISSDTLISVLNRANVDVYALEIWGSGNLEEMSLLVLARETGGRYYFHGNISEGLRDVEQRQANDYYQLSWRRVDDGEVGKVVVRTGSEDHRITARRRWVTPSP